MINIVGTSHVSKDSIKKIDEAFEQHQPEVVCLELDMGRLNSLLSGDKSLEAQSLTHSLLARFQRYIGEKTGMMPGEEMLYAYERAKQEDLEIYLIDRDIKITLNRIKSVNRKEKAKALALMPLSFLGGGKFDYKSIPSQEDLDELTDMFEEEFPELYQALLEERDIYMSDALKSVKARHEDENIIAVVGAAHQKGLQEKLNEIDSQSSVEKEEK